MWIVDGRDRQIICRLPDERVVVEHDQTSDGIHDDKPQKLTALIVCSGYHGDGELEYVREHEYADQYPSVDIPDDEIYERGQDEDEDADILSTSIGCRRIAISMDEEGSGRCVAFSLKMVSALACNGCDERRG